MMITVFGKPRAGKTTLAAWAADRAQHGRPLRVGFPLHRTMLQEHAPYERVYSNFPLKGCYKIDAVDFGRRDIRNSLILIDEAAMDFNNRDHKTADRKALNWFRVHGHYQNDIWLFSQSNDCDKVIRELSLEMLHVVKRGKVSLVTPVERVQEIDGDIKEGFYGKGFFNSLVLRRKKFYHMFNSWDAPELEKRPNIPW